MRLPRTLSVLILLAATAGPALGEVTLTPFTSGTNPYGDDFPTWSPDGSRIVYQSQDDDVYNPSLYYKDLGGVTEHLYSEAGAASANFMHPAFSPDGQWVVYARLDGTWYHLYRRPAAGGPEAPITTGTGGPNLASTYGDFSPTFSPDGEWIVFTSSRGSTDFGYVDLWRVRLDGTGLQRLTNDNSVFDYLWATWRPGTSTVVYSRQLELLRITVGSGISNPTPMGLEGNHPSFSPDGSILAYDRDNDLYLAHYASGIETPLTQSSAYEESPVWSPSGTRLAFSWYSNDKRAIWIADDVLTVPTVPSTLGRIKATYR